MRKIAQKLFESLWYCDIDRCYILLNDLNFKRKIYAESDEEAIKKTGWEENN